MLVSVLLKKIRSVISFSLGMSFGLYTAYALRAVLGGDFLGYITPFYYFDANAILEHGKLNSNMTALSIVIIGVSLGGSYMLYIRRNIHSL